MTDTRALKVLFNTYWSPAGWKRNPVTPAADLEFAIAAGVMFPPAIIGHEAIVNWLLKARSQVTRKRVTSAFLASLSSRRLELRSALGSYAVARNFPRHAFTPRRGGPGGYCNVCGEYDDTEPQDLSILNFERYKWGGVRHDYPLYMALDLQLLKSSEVPAPNPADETIVAAILETADTQPDQGKLGDLENAIIPVLRSNKDERRTLIQILGYAGILQPRDYPGYFKRFISFPDRDEPPWHKNDWPYPVSLWRGGDRVNWKAVAFWFPKLAPRQAPG